MDKARRAYAKIEYNGRDITDAVSSGLISLEYTDNTDKADDLQIEIEDRDGNWAGDWYPKVAAAK